LEGVLVLHEVLHELKCKRQEVMLKLDFEKAYDKVNWEFLEEVMEKKRFHDKWIQWVLICGGGGAK
jgi:hypothetical protein